MKIVLYLLAFVIVGCSSQPIQEDTKHFHGKNIHEIKKMTPPPPPAPGTLIHTHSKNTHELKKVP